MNDGQQTMNYKPKIKIFSDELSILNLIQNSKFKTQN
jgi:hypothetical protein